MPDGKNDKLIFLLGAGASVKAGVPDTYRFINGNNGFREWLNNQGNKQKELEILDEILNTLKHQNTLKTFTRAKIDVELVLGALNAINHKKDYIIVNFYDNDAFKFNSDDDIEALKTLESDLKKFIRDNVVVGEDSISYLAPLIAFATTEGPQKSINIFSMNFDTCIEMLCMKNKLTFTDGTYTDGLELNWNPEIFEKEFNIKLFKLHGSILWYSIGKDSYVKIPVEMGGKKEIDIITGGEASPFILYPTGRKWEYTEHLESLTTEFRKHLKSAEICIVVGYSFRDDDILDIFFEAAKENPELTIILISPEAGKVFEEKLRYRDEKRFIPSTISDKVICLNYTFESVLKDNELYRLYLECKNKIPLIRKTRSDAEKAKLEGKQNEYLNKLKDCIDSAIGIEDVITIENILNIFKQELGINPLKPNSWEGNFNEKKRFSISYSLAIFYLLNGDKKGKDYFKYLRDSLRDVLDAGKKYYDWKVKLVELNEKKEENKEEIKGIENNLENLIKQFPPDPSFYSWSERGNNLEGALKSFEDFIQDKLKVPNDSISALLKEISDSCESFVKISGIPYLREKYEVSDIVTVGVNGTKIETQRKNDFEKGLENLIKSIKVFIEQYDEIIKD